MSAVMRSGGAALGEERGSAARVVVIGGGIAGLSAAFRLSQSLPEVEIALIEHEERLGGKIVTESRAGYLIEGGPEALLAAKPQALALCEELGLADQLTAPRAENRAPAMRIRADG